MNEILLVPSPAIWPVLEFEIDILQSALDQDYFVTYVFCNGDYGSCIANKENSNDLFNPFTCIRCKNKSRNALKLLTDQSKVNIIENNVDFKHSDYLQKATDLKCEIFSKEIREDKIKKIVDIDGCDIFDSALSTLMTTLKDSKPNLIKHKRLFLDYLLEGLKSYYFYSDLLKKQKFEKIIIFNGRVSRYRPIIRICKKYNIYFEVLEYPEYTFDRYILTPNQYPHDFSYRSQILRDFVDNSPINKNEKIKIGQALIEDSLNHIENHGIGIGNFVKHQKKNQLPHNWNANIFNIVVFTSSDFENAGIPEYYNKLFGGSQAATIKELRNLLPNEIHITVRIHPNQIDKDLVSAKTLESLQSNNITVIKASDKIDSYYLVKKGDIIITFGSQLSVESAYLGKSVIVFGNSNFESFNFTKNVGKDVLLASKYIKNLYFNNIPLFENIQESKNEACLHMFARKYQGVSPKYLQKNSYYGGKFLINGSQKQISIDKNIFILTKYLGAPIVLLNIYSQGGIKKVLNTLKSIINLKNKKYVKN
jgi:hypothetical protein